LLLVLIGVFFVHACLEFGAVWLPRLAVWIYSHDRAVRVVRITSLVAFLAGFQTTPKLCTSAATSPARGARPVTRPAP
jgi:hypothetical protein